jgi:hypothetical protein
LHGTEYRVELYKRADEMTSSKNFEQTREATVREMAQKSQETGREEAEKTQLMTKKHGKENGDRE